MALNEQDLRGFVMDEKPVYDWNRLPIGTVADLRRDPKTKGARGVVVTLSPEARTRLGTNEEILEIPMSFVFGIRKESVSLDRSLNELRRLERVASVLR